MRQPWQQMELGGHSLGQAANALARVEAKQAEKFLSRRRIPLGLEAAADQSSPQFFLFPSIGVAMSVRRQVGARHIARMYDQRTAAVP